MTRSLPKTISVVIPALNEAGELSDTIQRAKCQPEVCEITVVDGGSGDDTCTVAAHHGCRVLTSPPGRGGQMRLGAQRATGDVVLLLHADTWLPTGAGQAALECFRDPLVVAGGFWKVFRDPPWLLRGSRFKCALRFHLRHRILGDQAMFIRRDTLEAVGGVPEMALMEEFELCRRLRQVGRLVLANATVTTSSRRFKEFGVVRGYWRIWRVSTLYHLGVPPDQLRQIYERKGG